MTHLLDTSAVLAHVRNEPGAGLVQDLFERDDVSVFLCSVTLAELARRLRDLGATKEEAWATIESTPMGIGSGGGSLCEQLRGIRQPLIGPAVRDRPP